MRPLLLCCSLVSCARVGGPVEAAGDAPGLHVDFATSREGAEILGRSDSFTRGLSAYDAAIRGRDGEADYRARAAGAVLPWTSRERRRWGVVIDDLSKVMVGLTAPSLRVVLVKVGDDLEFGLPHTRANAVVLPQGRQGRRRAGVVLAHELFHVWSRHDPTLADRTYGLLGFEVIDEVNTPQSMEPRRVSNPDAVGHRHAMALTIPDGTVYIVPFLVGSLDAQASLARPMLDNLSVRLWVVDPQTGELSDGSSYSDAYHDRVARNTGYVMHPEEVLADNFALLLARRMGRQLLLSDPQLVDELQELLAAP